MVIVLALVLWSKSVGSQTSDNLTLPGSDSQNATEVLNKRFPVQANGIEGFAPGTLSLAVARWRWAVYAYTFASTW